MVFKNIKAEIKEFDKLIKKYPNICELYIGRAKLYGQIKQYKKAVEDYEKGRASCYCNDIMKICENNNLIGEAEKLYTKAINADKNNAVNYMRRGYFYMRTWRKDKALCDLETCLKLFPKDKFIVITAKKLINYLNSTNAPGTASKVLIK